MAGQNPQAPATTTLQYINSADSDFSLGIDVRSAENQIDPGYVLDLLNADVVEKRVRKRQGYQGYAGNIPVRVTSLTYDASNGSALLGLDSAISLQTPISLDMVRSSPLLMYGKSSIFTSGPFTTSGNSLQYYSAFGTPNRKQLTAPSGTLVVPGTEHGIPSATLFTGIVESTSVVDRSFSEVITDSVAINDSTFDIDIGYTVEATTTAFVYYKDASTVTGQTYVATLSHTGSPQAQTFTIPASTHDLDNFNIIIEVQQEQSGTHSTVIPDSVLIATNGDITVGLTNDTGGSLTYYILLSACPIANAKNGVVNAQSTGVVTLTGLTTPWILTSIYLEQTPGGIRELVKPDTVTYDDSTATATISFTNESASALNFITYYDYGDIRSNLLTISDPSIISTGVDHAPQITIWGLDHNEIYTTKSAREGWVTHIDSYRRAGQQEMISGLGGNLFQAQDFTLASVQYGYPTLFPRLSARTSTSQILGPLLWGTGETPARSRGYLTADGSGTHWATVIGAQFDTGTGLTRYTIAVPNKAIMDSTGTPTTLSSVVSTTSGLEDYFTVGSMSYKIHEGTFKIEQVVDVSADTIQILVNNPSVDSNDYDDLSTAGEGGVFTDQYNWLTTAPFIPGDTLISEPLGDTFICTVMSSSGQITVTAGLIDKLQLPGGLLFTGNRISSVIPVRTGAPASTPSTTNLVRGDMISYSGIERQLRVLYINAGNDLNSNVSGDGTTGTVTVTSGSTQYLTVGQIVALAQAGEYTGEQTVTDVTSSTTFTFDTTFNSSITGAILVGNTMQVDEQLEWSDTSGDSNEFQVETRWIPIEAPDDSFSLTPSTHVRYFDANSYTDQPFLRSTMSLNNMYFTNYDDPVYKFEGATNYRSGLIDWQPALFLTQETSGAVIAAGLRTLTYSAIVAVQGKLVITEDQSNVLPVGTTVKLSGSNVEYTVTSYTDDTATGGTNFYLQVNQALDATVSATGSIIELGIYKYYFRLNAVDINNNVIASATTSSSDYSVELTGDAAVQLKLVGMPAWDVYDYQRLEVQIYRTKKNQSAPFYLVTTLPMDFNNTTGYLNFRDSFADTDLTQLDTVNTALKGQELGTAWTGPLRSRYLTSINNRLVLANIQDYPQLDLQIVGDATLSKSTIAGGSLLFRKDITDSGLTSDTVNRLKVEWVNGVSGTVSALTPGTNDFTFTTSGSSGVISGDWIYLTYATVGITGRDLTYCGWYQVASASGTSVTVNLTGAAAATSYPDSYVVASATANVPVLLGADGSLGTIGSNLFDTFDAMFRASLAINAVMRMTDITLTGQSDFTPWMIARAGNDLTPAGRLIIKQPKNVPTSLSIIPTFSGYNLFINAVKTPSGNDIGAVTRLYPSRIIVSYQNYPEIFDNPTSILDTDSDSAIDINSADGQEITGVIPFFGSAAFSAAQQTAVLVVFKTNSIYLVDLGAKAAGQPAVQRLETEGLGCTAPYSIASTKSGIMFANQSGMYVLRRTQAIEYIGRYMERNWVEKVDLDQLSLAQGHHYGIGRLYKLSVPLASEITPTGYIEPSDVYVYNHTGEDEVVNSYTAGKGAWSRYDNHPAIGWANLLSDAFFAATSGRVFILRQTGLLEDYRDDSEAINFQIDSRPNDFGNSGIRKVIDAIIVDYRTGSQNLGTSLNFSVDLSNEYEPTTPMIIPVPVGGTDLSDTIGNSVVPILHKLDRRRGVFFNVRIFNTGIDESLEIAGLNYKVAALTDKGIQQAAQTLGKKGNQ